MPLMMGDSVLFNAVSFRIVHIWGRYGGGKTALAHQLAHDLMLRFKFRYLLSNVLSTWADDPADVFLADGLTVDAVMLLDEAGVFMRTASETDQFLLALRKLNIVILCPSFFPPSRTARMLTIQRVFDGNVIGLPFWWYKWHLDMGVLNEVGNLYWRNPEQIFGIFDTDGYPDNADKLLWYLKKWFKTAQANTGYARAEDTRHSEARIIGFTPETGGESGAGAASDAQTTEGHPVPAYVADVGRAADDFTDAARKIEKALSVPRGKKTR